MNITGVKVALSQLRGRNKSDFEINEQNSVVKTEQRRVKGSQFFLWVKRRMAATLEIIEAAGILMHKQDAVGFRQVTGILILLSYLLTPAKLRELAVSQQPSL